MSITVWYREGVNGSLGDAEWPIRTETHPCATAYSTDDGWVDVIEEKSDGDHYLASYPSHLVVRVKVHGPTHDQAPEPEQVFYEVQGPDLCDEPCVVATPTPDPITRLFEKRDLVADIALSELARAVLVDLAFAANRAANND
jgi:hypothetical protein